MSRLRAAQCFIASSSHSSLQTAPPAGRKDVKLVAVRVAGKQVSPEDVELSEKKLILSGLPAGQFEVEIDVDIKPQVSMSQLQLLDVREQATHEAFATCL
jgi:hypothetical protein